MFELKDQYAVTRILLKVPLDLIHRLSYEIRTVLTAVYSFDLFFFDVISFGVKNLTMSLHDAIIDTRVLNNKSNKLSNGFYCNGNSRIYSEQIGKELVCGKDKNMHLSNRQEVNHHVKTQNSSVQTSPELNQKNKNNKKSFRHSTENLRDKSSSSSTLDHIFSTFNLRKNKANSNTHLSYTNNNNNNQRKQSDNRNENFYVDKKMSIKNSMHFSRKGSNPQNFKMEKTKALPSRSETRSKSNSIIKRLSFKFKSNSTDSPVTPLILNEKILNNNNNNNNNNSANFSNKNSNYESNNTSNFRKFNSMSIESNYQSTQESSNLNLETLNKVFRIFDRDQDGSITIEDVQAIMNSFNFLQNELEMPSIEQIQVAFEKFDDNKNGAIEFGEFVNILKSAASQNVSPNETCQDLTKTYYNGNSFRENNNETTKDMSYDIDQFKSDYSDLVMSNMKLIFEQFDKDNDGKITKYELNFVMRNLFPDEEITENDINDMLKAADLDNNGFIDFDEFANMFNLYKNNLPNENIDSTEFCTPNHTLKTSVRSRVDLNLSNKSISSKLNSRSNSKEPGRQSRTQSQSNSASQSPNVTKYRKVVQLFTASQLMDLKAAFTMFDKNGDQKISETELLQVMRYLGLKTSEQEVKAMIEVVDKNRNGYVDYDEFIQMMTQTQVRPLSVEDELKKTFAIFDIDGNGFISEEEIKRTMQNIGENLTDAEVRDMIKAADKNGDGKIDINEFSGLLSGTSLFQS
ncbi:unnamed protein product [Brachionus calyciflorus]|uniref:EF-hand domain-containing protein n=1 Tax=Brachionus calyciflorus TaxID=104777 RepID=A0A813NMI4_9BILA|nr:unnamed protein product [Brachionus calyciflorus]